MEDIDNNSRVDLINTISKRLFRITATLLIIGFLAAGLNYYVLTSVKFPFIIVCIIMGFIGGFVSIQKRLRELGLEELTLLSKSINTTALPPLVGGILALVLYIIFVSGIISGDLFPSFENPEYATNKTFSTFLGTRLVDYNDNAKALFWSFVAGFSERFVLNLIQNIEGRHTDQGHQG